MTGGLLAGDFIAGVVSLRIQQLDVACETKTRDNVFVHILVSVQYQVYSLLTSRSSGPPPCATHSNCKHCILVKSVRFSQVLSDKVEDSFYKLTNQHNQVCALHLRASRMYPAWISVSN